MSRNIEVDCTPLQSPHAPDDSDQPARRRGRGWLVALSAAVALMLVFVGAGALATAGTGPDTAAGQPAAVTVTSSSPVPHGDKLPPTSSAVQPRNVHASAGNRTHQPTNGTGPALMNLELVTPPIDTQAGCRLCGGRAVWDEVHGWMHQAAARPDPVPPHQPDVDWTRSMNLAAACNRRG